jgi:hypothetical protein
MPDRATTAIRILVLLLSVAIARSESARGAEAAGGVIPVTLRQQTDGSCQLLRDGKPFPIKGVGGEASLKLLADCGGNAVRTWGADQLQAKLDEAQKLGLTVIAGIWLGHERHGFDYSNAKQVADQLEQCRATIAKFKDHPALLMWGLGNEMEGYEKGDNPAIWKAINDIAVMAKELDPNHPTMTVVAEIGGERVPCIHRLCPAIDIVGVNSYGGGPSVVERYKKAGGTKPMILTEFGPNGAWETAKTSWGAPIEPTSTAKADFYRKTYQASTALESRRLCLGSCAFLWGAKQEATTTWFGMLLADGSRTEAVDTMAELWSGKAIAHPCPKIKSLKLADAGNGKSKPGATIHATLEVADANNLKAEWQLQDESQQYLTGGDHQSAPKTHPDAIVHGDLHGAEVHLPNNAGGYRLFVTIRDDHGGAAVVNVPLLAR